MYSTVIFIYEYIWYISKIIFHVIGICEIKMYMLLFCILFIVFVVKNNIKEMARVDAKGCYLEIGF